MRGIPTHRLVTQGPEKAAEPEKAAQCAQCGRDMISSPSIDWCSEGCMRQWLRAGTRQPEAVLGRDADAAADRMARRHAYLEATTGSWPEAWRSDRSA